MDIEGMILGIFCLIFGIVVASIGVIMIFATPAVAIFFNNYRWHVLLRWI